MVVEDNMVGRGVEIGLNVGPGAASEPMLVGAAVVVEYGEKKDVLDGEAKPAGPGVEVRLEGEGWGELVTWSAWEAGGTRGTGGLELVGGEEAEVGPGARVDLEIVNAEDARVESWTDENTDTDEEDDSDEGADESVGAEPMPSGGVLGIRAGSSGEALRSGLLGALTGDGDCGGDDVGADKVCTGTPIRVGSVTAPGAAVGGGTPARIELAAAPCVEVVVSTPVPAELAAAPGAGIRCRPSCSRRAYGIAGPRSWSRRPCPNRGCGTCGHWSRSRHSDPSQVCGSTGR